jgi:hypothetical protein
VVPVVRVRAAAVAVRVVRVAIAVVNRVVVRARRAAAKVAAGPRAAATPAVVLRPLEVTADARSQARQAP